MEKLPAASDRILTSAWLILGLSESESDTLLISRGKPGLVTAAPSAECEVGYEDENLYIYDQFCSVDLISRPPTFLGCALPLQLRLLCGFMPRHLSSHPPQCLSVSCEPSHWLSDALAAATVSIKREEDESPAASLMTFILNVFFLWPAVLWDSRAEMSTVSVETVDFTAVRNADLSSELKVLCATHTALHSHRR